MTYEEKRQALRLIGELQGECAVKARDYKRDGFPELAARFERASFTSASAHLLIQAALMAEREFVKS